jgi:hypothetical protein
MLAAAGAVTLGTDVLPRWLGSSALATAVGLLASLPFFSAEPPTFMLALIWIIAASVVLIRRIDTPDVVPARAADAVATRPMSGLGSPPAG